MSYPMYVKLEGCCLRLEGNSYYRDAGNWEVDFREVDGKLIVHEPSKSSPMNHAHGRELVPCSKEEWREDNSGYVH